MKEKLVSLKESIFGNMSWVEIVLALIGVSAIALFVAVSSAPVGGSNLDLNNFLARPVSDITVDELILILFILGLIFRK